MISNRKMKIVLKSKLDEWTYVNPNTYDALEKVVTTHFHDFLGDVISEFNKSGDSKLSERHVHVALFSRMGNNDGDASLE